MCESSDAPAADAAEELERAFLRFHGSLFTRIGMETAEALTADCVCALRLCLEATPDDTAAHLLRCTAPAAPRLTNQEAP